MSYLQELLAFKAESVAKVSPNWTKNADNVAISSGVLPFAILQAKIEMLEY